MLLQRCLLVFFVIWFSSSAFGTLSLPSGLSDGDQELVLQYLGFTTGFRLESNPRPLGLYSGIEIGVSVEDIPTGDIGYLGNGASVQKSIYYPQITLGKGIFDNLDLFFSFTPYMQGTGIGIYAGGLRWDFFQATFVPAFFSLLISAAATNVDNLFLAQTEGVDLICGVSADTLGFYIGAGTLYGQGQFDPSITIESAQTNIVARSFHTLVGASLTVGPAFSTLELDNYNTTTFSFKLGARL